jgi:hypothetical protein
MTYSGSLARGASVMAFYRAYFVDVPRHIVRPPKVFEADDDAAALKQAQQFADGYDVELWDHDRFIALIGPDGEKPKP